MRHLVTQLYLVSLCILCYEHALNGKYVFDDRVAIVENVAVNKYPTNFTAIMYNDFWGNPLRSNASHKSYRPLVTLLFHYEYAVLGFTAFHMKCINLCLHIINTVLIWYWLKDINNIIMQYQPYQTTQPSSVALLTASLYALHPVHTEAVCGIVSRADLLCCLLYLIAGLVTVKDFSNKRILSTAVCILTTICGILVKETAITIPILCILVEYTKQQICKLSTFFKQFKAVLKNKNIASYIIIALGVLIVRFWWGNFQMPHFEAADNPRSHSEHFKTRLLTQHYLYVKNFQIQIMPTMLSFDWAFGCIPLMKDFTDYRFLSILTMYVFILWPLRYFRRRFEVIFGLALCIIPFLPASGIIPVGFVIAERVLYIPSIGFCYLVALGYTKLIQNYGACCLYMKYIVHTALVATIIFLILRCRQRATEWMTEELLFTSALKVCPNNAKVHYNIARLAMDHGNSTKAFHHYHKALDLYPTYNAALMNIGNLYRETGDLKSAELYLKKAITLKPDYATAWMNLGVVYAADHNYEMALKCYQKALRLRPNYANCHYNMGNMYMERKEYRSALHHWKYAVALKPDFVKAWTNIITMLDSLSLYEDALKLSEEALALHKDDSAIMLIRANVLGKLSHYQEAEALYLHIIRRDPYNYLYHTNLGVLYHRWNNLIKAKEHYNLAIEANNVKAHTARENLKMLKEKS